MPPLHRRRAPRLALCRCARDPPRHRPAQWSGDTGLITAALRGHVEMVLLLLDRGANVDAVNKVRLRRTHVHTKTGVCMRGGHVTRRAVTSRALPPVRDGAGTGAAEARDAGRRAGLGPRGLGRGATERRRRTGARPQHRALAERRGDGPVREGHVVH